MSPLHLSNFRAKEFNNFPGGKVSAWGMLASLCQRALPQSCAFCTAPCGNRLVCAACQSGLPRIAGACPVCALPAPGGAICGACVVRPPPFVAAFAAFAYEYPLDRLLHAFKYGGHLSHAEYFAEALSAAVSLRPRSNALARCAGRAAARAVAPARARIRPGRGNRPARGAPHRSADDDGAAPHARHAGAGGAAMEGSREERPRRVRGRSFACRNARRHRRRRHDYRRDARLRRGRRAPRGCRRRRGVGGRAYTSADATAR